MNDPAERDKWVSAPAMGNSAPTSTTRGKPKTPRNFPEDEEAAAKIAQTDAAMLQPLLEHTNAYLTGDAQQAGDRHRRAQQPGSAVPLEPVRGRQLCQDGERTETVRPPGLMPARLHRWADPGPARIVSRQRSERRIREPQSLRASVRLLGRGVRRGESGGAKVVADNGNV